MQENSTRSQIDLTSPSTKSTQTEHTNYSRKTKEQAKKYKNPHNKNTTKKSPYAQTKN